MEDLNKGKLFSDALAKEVRAKFHNVDSSPLRPGRRIHFDNAGGAFRLKSALEAFYLMDSIPDCPERTHDVAKYMNGVMAEAEENIRIMLNAHKGGQIITKLTASQAIWDLTGVIAENIPGTNIVTTKLEHPCAFDAARFFAEKTGKELRAADTNPVTGGVDVEAITKLIDQDTCLLSVIFASNISGAVLDIPAIVKAARAIKPDLYIIVDGVQHAPHGVIDVDSLDLDGVDFAPYKFFGCRGSGIGYASDRVSKLPHAHLLGKDKDNLTWSMGSPAPAHYAVINEIFKYVCWLGSQTCQSTDLRTLYVEGMTNIKLQERALMYHMLEGTEELPGLRHIPGVKVFMDTEDMTSRDFILAIALDNWGYNEAVQEYERRGIYVYERVVSSIYSVRMLKSFGIEGCIRVSPLHCNSIEEINTFLKETIDMVQSRA